MTTQKCAARAKCAEVIRTETAKVRPDLVIITGTSGAGKSAVGELLPGATPLDRIGFQGGEHGERKWLVDTKKLTAKDTCVYGTCDNLAEVAKTMVDLSDFENPDLLIVVITPSHDLFKRTTHLKSLNPDLPQEWRKDFVKKSKMSVKEIDNFLEGKVRLAIRNIREGSGKARVHELEIINAPLDIESIDKGWHEGKDTNPSQRKGTSQNRKEGDND